MIEIEMNKKKEGFVKKINPETKNLTKSFIIPNTVQPLVA